DGRRRTAADGEARPADHAGRALRSDLPEDGLPVLGLHAVGSDSGGSDRGAGRSSGTVRARSRDGFSDCGRCARPNGVRRCSRQAVASDLREGKVTMAVIHALERCTPEERAQIETVLCDRAFNGVTHAQIMEILQRYGSLEAATARASRYAESAAKAICTFPDSGIKRALLWAPEFVV